MKMRKKKKEKEGTMIFARLVLSIINIHMILWRCQYLHHTMIVNQGHTLHSQVLIGRDVIMNTR